MFWQLSVLFIFLFLTSTVPHPAESIDASKQTRSSTLRLIMETRPQRTLIDSNQGQRLSRAFLTLITGSWTNAETSLQLN